MVNIFLLQVQGTGKNPSVDVNALDCKYFFCRADIIDLCYSVMAPLIAEYDRHMDELTEQLQRYQVKNTVTTGHAY